MDHGILASLVSVGLLAGILMAVEFGRRFGARRARAALAAGEEADPPGRGAVDSAVFGLMGLLLAFTFSGALTRWDERRSLAIQETNAIGTAWLRIDLLPAEAQTSMRDHFRGYLDARLETYRSFPDMTKVAEALRLVADHQQRIWTLAIPAARESTTASAPMLLLPALNEMFDLAAARIAVTEAHPPLVIYALLIGLVLASAFVAGHAMAPSKSRTRTHVIALAFALAATVYVVIDMEYPRLGFIRIDAIDQLLVDLRQTMK